MGLPMRGATGRAVSRWVPIAEPITVFLLIMLYIWWLRYSYRSSWILILGIILVSHRCRRERAETLGFRWSNFGACAREAAPLLVLTALALFSAGLLLKTFRNISFDQALVSLAAYWPWGLLQQYLLNGYFVNRFEAVWPSRQALVCASALFSGAHLPNWFLMAVTFLAGYLCATIYQKHRNMYFLGLAHGTIGFLLFLVVPDSISHNLRVGPGWFR